MAPLPPRGFVSLVGAGPGDPGLLTLRARDLLASCDSVLHDHLVHPEILAHAPRHAEIVSVGKIGHGSQVEQDRIHAMMIERAWRGMRVVRLQGGCPTLFGRVGEESAALRAAGVAFEIVPGVSSALAAPAFAGIPLTHRGIASSVCIVAGHCATGERALPSGAASAETLVVLMGVRTLPRIVSELLAAGRSPDTPAACVSRGSWADQREVVATLGTLAARVEKAGLEAPAVIVIGEVVRLRNETVRPREDLERSRGGGVQPRAEGRRFGDEMDLRRGEVVRASDGLERPTAKRGSVPACVAIPPVLWFVEAIPTSV